MDFGDGIYKGEEAARWRRMGRSSPRRHTTPRDHAPGRKSVVRREVRNETWFAFDMLRAVIGTTMPICVGLTKVRPARIGIRSRAARQPGTVLRGAPRNGYGASDRFARCASSIVLERFGNTTRRHRVRSARDLELGIAARTSAESSEYRSSACMARRSCVPRGVNPWAI